MGLGLKMSQRIVNLYQGKLQIESIYGQGTLISVELPVIPSDLSLSAFDLNDDFLMPGLRSS